MNTMLIIVLGIFGFYIYMGSKMGLVKMIFYLASSVVLLIVSFVISPAISTQMIENKAVVRYVDDKIEKAYEKYEQLEKNKKQPKKPKKKKGTISDKGNIFAKDVTKKLGKAYLTPLVIRTAVFLIVYLAASLILLVTGKFFGLLAKLPVLNSINRLGGAGAGAVKGLIVVWLLFMLLTIFMDKEIAAKGLGQIGENEVLRILYDNNLITKIIESFIIK